MNIITEADRVLRMLGGNSAAATAAAHCLAFSLWPSKCVSECVFCLLAGYEMASCSHADGGIMLRLSSSNSQHMEATSASLFQHCTSTKTIPPHQLFMF